MRRAILAGSCGLLISCAGVLGSHGGGANIRAVLSPGSIEVDKGRLYFDAWVAHGSRSQTATLEGGGSTQQLTFQSSCVGVSASGGDRSPDYDEACSFDVSAAAPGHFTLAIADDGHEVARTAFELRQVPVTFGRTGMIVAPTSRASTAYHRSESVVFYHLMDATDPVSMLQFVWIRGDEVVSVGEGSANGPQLEVVGPAIDVVPVVGPGAPRENGDPTALTLLVFKDASELVASMQLPGGDLYNAELVRAEPPPARVVDAARSRAVAAAEKTIRPFANNVTYPEAVVCAVYTDKDALHAFVELKDSEKWSSWAAYHAVAAYDASRDDRISDRRREKLQQRAADKASEVVAENRYGEANRATLLAKSRKFQKGCLTKLAGG